MRAQNIQRERKLWLIFIATILLSGIFAVINLYEYINVGIMNNTGGYPFGGEGPTPWYYKTPDLYTIVNLIFGLVFLSIFLVAIWAYGQIKRNILIIVFIASILLVLFQFIS